MSRLCPVTVSAFDWAGATRGSRCTFVPHVFPGGCGTHLKAYRTLREARVARDRQAEAARWLLAPFAGPLCRVTVEGQATPRFGYLTEWARPWHVSSDGRFDKNGATPQCRLLRNLSSLLRERRFRVSDLHEGNVGWVIRLGRNTLVCIDFDEGSMG